MRLDETTLTEYSLGGFDDNLRHDVEGELCTSPTMHAELRAIEHSLSGVAEVEEPAPTGRTRSVCIARFTRLHVLPSGVCGPLSPLF